MRCIDCRYHTWVDAKYHCNVGEGKPMEIIGDIALRDMPCDIFDKTEKKQETARRRLMYQNVGSK